MPRCPKCGKEWPGYLEICPHDRTELPRSSAPEGPAGEARARRPVTPAPSGAVAAADLALSLAIPELPTEELASGSMIGEYRIERKIGEGGMATVYAAIQPFIGKKAAIKVISRGLSRDPDVVARFVQEARSVNKIGHPNIVDVFSFGVLPDARPYFVMEWLQGETLGERLSRERISLGEVLDILEQVIDALEAAHEKQIIHRDLKPDNVFLVTVRGNRELVKLLDFGIAKLSSSMARGSDSGLMSKTRSGHAMGTPEYMSPEQARGKNVDYPADVYSLGVVAFHMVTGHLPYSAETAIDLINLHLSAPVPHARDLEPTVAEELDELLTEMMAKDPARRPSLATIRSRIQDLREKAPRGEASGRIRAFVPGRPGAGPSSPGIGRPDTLTAWVAAEPALDPGIQDEPAAPARKATWVALGATALAIGSVVAIAAVGSVRKHPTSVTLPRAALAVAPAPSSIAPQAAPSSAGPVLATAAGPASRPVVAQLPRPAHRSQPAPSPRAPSVARATGNAKSHASPRTPRRGEDTDDDATIDPWGGKP